FALPAAIVQLQVQQFAEKVRSCRLDHFRQIAFDRRPVSHLQFGLEAIAKSVDRLDHVPRQCRVRTHSLARGCQAPTLKKRRTPTLIPLLFSVVRFALYEESYRSTSETDHSRGISFSQVRRIRRSFRSTVVSEQPSLVAISSLV